jgi:penicillin-binding protein 2
MKPLHIFFFVSAVFVVLIGHLFKMQILDHDKYLDLSERNRIRPVVLQAPRGIVLDRFGRELISNRLAFDCYLIPKEGNADRKSTFKQLAVILGRDEIEIIKKYDRRAGSYSPVLIAGDLDKDEAIQIEESMETLPGIFIKTRPVREYPAKEAASHVLGYVGALNRTEFDHLKSYGYNFHDETGKDGVEKAYESYLRGAFGSVHYEADHQGRLLRVLHIQEPLEGRSLQLTLDLDLQVHVNQLLEQQKGAIAVMELEKGGLLSLNSTPAYDPNHFIQASRETGIVQSLLTNPDLPLLNRAIAGLYPPGSTFKMVTAKAGLSNEKFNKESRFTCNGSLSLGNYVFRCWRRGGHGSQSLIEAIEHSCNVFFYNVGKRLSSATLSDEAKRFGLGSKTGVDLPGEKRGLVPNKKWKRKNMGKPWYQGETVIFAIGQGYLLTTPLQVLRAAARVAANGTLLQPHVVKQIGSINVEPRPTASSDQNDEDWDLIREGMRRVVQSPMGTGQRAKSSKVEISGKTGTAQAPSGKDHAWFVGFAPSENPRAAVVVFLEHGGKGGYSAASIAGKIFNWMSDKGYFT